MKVAACAMKVASPRNGLRAAGMNSMVIQHSIETLSATFTHDLQLGPYDMSRGGRQWFWYSSLGVICTLIIGDC